MRRNPGPDRIHERPTEGKTPREKVQKKHKGRLRIKPERGPGPGGHQLNKRKRAPLLRTEGLIGGVDPAQKKEVGKQTWIKQEAVGQIPKMAPDGGGGGKRK